ncbi:MAG: LysR substrate-binding domain-containing protein [Lautropia sp.]
MQISEQGSGSLAVGLGAAPSLIGLACATKTFRRDNPAARVRAGTLDFTIGPKPTFGLGDDFHVETLLPNTSVVVAWRWHPLAGTRSLADLLDADWILTSGTKQARAEFERFFTAHRLTPPQPAVEYEYVIALLALLTGSDVVTLLLRQRVESGVTRDLVGRIAVRETIACDASVPELGELSMYYTGLPPESGHDVGTNDYSQSDRPREPASTRFQPDSSFGPWA